jgi:succinate dehydrogenase / fumarate reductase, cytochrome b subunit
MPPPAERPLSPHLQVYRPMYTMVLSIMHRATGLYLSGSGRFLATLPMRIVLALALAAFWYHLFTGIRHLAWDAGHGFEKRSARRSGALVVVAAAFAFVATLFLTPAGRFFAGTP